MGRFCATQQSDKRAPRLIALDDGEKPLKSGTLSQLMRNLISPRSILREYGAYPVLLFSRATFAVGRIKVEMNKKNQPIASIFEGQRSDQKGNLFQIDDRIVFSSEPPSKKGLIIRAIIKEIEHLLQYNINIGVSLGRPLAFRREHLLQYNINIFITNTVELPDFSRLANVRIVDIRDRMRIMVEYLHEPHKLGEGWKNKFLEILNQIKGREHPSWEALAWEHFKRMNMNHPIVFPDESDLLLERVKEILYMHQLDRLRVDPGSFFYLTTHFIGYPTVMKWIMEEISENDENPNNNRANLVFVPMGKTEGYFFDLFLTFPDLLQQELLTLPQQPLEFNRPTVVVVLPTTKKIAYLGGDQNARR